MDDQHDAVPLTPNVARRLAEELFQQQNLWKRDALAAEVERLHTERGGIPGKQDPLFAVKKALSMLHEDGLVIKPFYGHWKWRDSSVANTDLSAPAPGDVEDDIPVDEDETTSSERVLGKGPESVYLYFNPNDRKLAELTGRSVWECKVGRTASLDTGYRISSQGIKTALSHVPVVGLVLRTPDSSALEKALHASLRLVEAQVADSPGAEWFMTSPALVEAWYEQYRKALQELAPDSQ